LELLLARVFPNKVTKPGQRVPSKLLSSSTVKGGDDEALFQKKYKKKDKMIHC